jgi:hypothetical protein
MMHGQKNTRLFTNGHGVIANKTLPVTIQQLVEDDLPLD